MELTSARRLETARLQLMPGVVPTNEMRGMVATESRGSALLPGFAQGASMIVGVLLGEALRTRVWTIPSPHSREALFQLSVWGALIAGVVASIAAVGARWRRPRAESRGMTACALTAVMGVVIAQLSWHGGWLCGAALWILILVGPGLAAWASERRESRQGRSRIGSDGGQS